MEEDQVVPKNFFFRKPHMRMFRMNPFDDAEMQLEMDNLRSSFDQAQIELRRSIHDYKGISHEIQNHIKRFEGAPSEPIQV
jgi:hypothetical protein